MSKRKDIENLVKALRAMKEKEDAREASLERSIRESTKPVPEVSLEEVNELLARFRKKP
ncbi:MAG TPA: hypothetical protein PLF25_07195 [Accumulibacter sp.]|nr:hypothetical protein [Accumulibacter sp.]